MNILLSSHGTDGAKAAEQAALAMCNENSQIKHLLVVPEFWRHMMGDDWLNNGASRDRYARYLESELGKEIDENISRVRQHAEQKGVEYQFEIIIGQPDQCLKNACNQEQYDLVVIGSPRPKNKPGLNSKMANTKVTKNLETPLLMVPYPDE